MAATARSTLQCEDAPAGFQSGIFNGQVLDAASLKSGLHSRCDEGKARSIRATAMVSAGMSALTAGCGTYRTVAKNPDSAACCWRLPGEKFTVVTLSNALEGRTNASPNCLAYQMVDIFLEDKLLPMKH